MGEWRYAVKISDCLDIMYGKDQKLVEDNDRGVFPILGTGGIMGYAKRYLCDKPSVLIGRKGTIDEPQYMDTPFWTIDTLYYTDVYPENSAKYLFYVFQTIPWKKYNEATGVPSLAGSTIGKIKISLPLSKNEQSKIAEILSTVDEAIIRTRALIEKYKNIKAGMMQHLLGSGDEVPLSQLCQITSGSTPATSDSSYWDGHHVWITPNDLSGINTPFISTSARKLTDSGVKKATRVLLPPNSVIISNRAPVGYCAIVTVPFTFNQGCKGLVCNPDTDPLYLYYYLSKSKSQLERVSSGTTFLELPKKELNRFLIRIPKTINEQQAISEQILAADERIQTERDYLAKLQDIKLGLMQDLLTNTVSVDALL